jgi:hypothetical protein
MGAQSTSAQPPEAWFEVPGSVDRAAAWIEGGVSMEALRLEGGRYLAATPISHTILLRYACFDPLAGEPAIPEALRAPAGSRLAIVQFRTRFVESYGRALEARGVALRWFLGEHAYIVQMDPAARGAVAQLPFVRWVGDVHAAYKLEEPLLGQVMSAPDASEAARYSILAVEAGPASKARVSRAIAALGGRVDKAIPEGHLLEATLTPAQLLAVARDDDVLFVDRWFEPTEYMDNVRIVGGANYVESVAGLRGEGVRGEVMDSELRMTHVDFQANPPIRHGAVGSTSASHGTSVFGIVFGSGTVNPMGRGVAPGAQGIFSSYSTLTNRYQHTARLLQPPYEAVFQTNSWGSCCTTQYGTQAADADTMLFDHRIVLLQAQANQGNTSSDVIAFAKNLISVGAVRHYNTLTLADDAHLGTSGSTGPAADGRIKPDLCFWYDSIYTTSATTDTSYTSTFGGTSAATPITAGHVALMHQMWHLGLFGNVTSPTGTVFSNRPKIATAKALMINTASPYPFTGPTADLRRVRQGWGRADAARLYGLRNTMLIVDQTDVLLPLQARTYHVRVAPGTAEFRATLCYVDPAGVPNSSRHRVNDLTLIVTRPDGTVFCGNNGLLESNESTPGGSPNRIDTVENVWIPNPAPGVWVVQVRADELVQDARPQTPGVIDADYGLVVSGILEACVADWNGDGVVDFNDLLEFVNDYVADLPRADLNGDGVIDFNDLLEFLNRHNGGC